MKRVKIAAIAGAFAASLTLASASSNGSETADGYVCAAALAPTTVSYTGTVEVVRIGNDGAEATVYSVEHRAPDLTKRIYVSPQSLHGDQIISKGDRTFAVDLARRRVVAGKNGAFGDELAFKNNYTLLRSNYRAVEEAPETFDGRSVEKIDLVNKYTGRTAMTIRVDRATKLVLEKQTFASDGSLIDEMRFESIAFSQPAATDFTVPTSMAVTKGAQLGEPSLRVDAVTKKAGFAAHDPKFLPEGFAPVEGNLVDIKGIRTLHLLYSDGIRTVSLFEHAGSASADLSQFHPKPVTIDGHDAEYANAGSTTLLAWRDGDMHYALVGDLGLDELKRIAASVAH